MSRLVIISDIHSKFNHVKKLPYGDIFIVAGDLTSMGYLHEVTNFIEWVNKFRFEHVVVIAGNHDFCFKDYELAKIMLKENNIIYLEDDFTVINGIKIYGTPVSPNFFNWAFMHDEPDLKKYWDAIPNDTDILITHCPPKGILDVNNKGESVGSLTLREKYDSGELSPKLHVFGHIHHSRGVYYNDTTTFINACLLSDNYILVAKPFVVDIDDDKNISVVDI